MRDLGATVLAAASRQMEQDEPFVRLVEVTIPTSPKTVLRLANYDRDIVHDTSGTGTPLTYQRYPVALGEFRESRTGDLAQIQVNIANVTRELMEFIDPYEGLIGEDVRIINVNAAAVDDPFAHLVFAGKVIAAEIDQDVAVFTLGQPNLNQQVCPARRFLTSCGVIRFGDAECGYIVPVSPGNTVGTGFDFCTRTLAACRERGDDEVARGLTRKHPNRFGGYPGLALGNP